MMCDIFIDKLDDWLEGELDSASAGEMERHYEQCAHCRALAKQARELRGALLEMGEAPAPQDLHQQMMAAVEKERTRGAKGSPRKLSWKAVAGITAAAAVLLVAVPLMGGLLFTRNLSSGSGMANTARSSYAYDMAMPEGAAEKSALQAMPSAAPAPMESPSAVYGGITGTTGTADMARAYDGQMNAGGGEIGASYGEKIIRTGSVSLESRQFDADVEALNALVAAYGGHVQSYNVSGVPYDMDPASYGRWANFSVRIPSGGFDAFLNDSKGIGNMLDTSIWSEDITANYHDTQLQLDTLRAQHTRLVELVAKAELVEDLVKLEAELQRVQYQIDSLTGTLRRWDDRVSYATVDIRLSEVRAYSYVKPVDPSLGERISDAFYQSINGLVELAQSALVGLIAILPYLGIVILLGGIVALIIRGRIKKRKSASQREE